jgi:hypothetical protein
VANLFRMYLHTGALNLLVRLRRQIADPPAAAAGKAATLKAAVSERTSAAGPAGRRASGDLSYVADEGSGVGGGELSLDGGALERQLAATERF